MTDDLLTLMRERIAVGLTRQKTMEAIEGWQRTAELTLKDGQKFVFQVANNTIIVSAGAAPEAEMKIESDEDTIRKLFLEQMNAASALLTRKLKVKGSASDLMKIRHIF